MKLTLELQGCIYTYEDPAREEYLAGELKEIFSRMLVSATFPPSVIDCEDGGRYEYLAKDDIVAKRTPKEVVQKRTFLATEKEDFN